MHHYERQGTAHKRQKKKCSLVITVSQDSNWTTVHLLELPAPPFLLYFSPSFLPVCSSPSSSFSPIRDHLTRHYTYFSLVAFICRNNLETRSTPIPVSRKVTNSIRWFTCVHSAIGPLMLNFTIMIHLQHCLFCISGTFLPPRFSSFNWVINRASVMDLATRSVLYDHYHVPQVETSFCGCSLGTLWVMGSVSGVMYQHC